MPATAAWAPAATGPYDGGGEVGRLALESLATGTNVPTGAQGFFRVSASLVP